MSKKNISLFVVLSLSVFSLACGKGDTGTSACSNPNVYITGMLKDGATYKPAYFKNNIATVLSNSDDDYAVGIAASKNNVYVAGISRSGSNNVATLWKNGVATLLEGAASSSEALDVALKGDQYFAVGTVNDGSSNRHAKIWSEGHSVLLDEGTSSQSQARRVFVNGDDVYVVGTVESSGDDHPAVWKNQVLTLLDEGGLSDLAAQVATSIGSDVYIMGQGQKALLESKRVIKIWKNGEPDGLIEASGDLYATGMAVVNGALYISAVVTSGGSYTTQIWKYGEATPIKSIPQYIAMGLASFGSNFYTVGYTNGSSANVLFEDPPAMMTSKNGDAPTQIENAYTHEAPSVLVSCH